MRKHTPEPWRVGRPFTVVSDTPVPGMGGSDAVEYYGGHLIGESIIEANARRIVACVNACAGMETEHLENQAMLGEALLDRFNLLKREVGELTNQRDELLAALTHSRGMLSNAAMIMKWFSIPKAQEILREINAVDKAIAKAKGGAVNHFPDAAKMAHDGLRLVPVEPTPEMISAATRDSVGFGTRASYQAMLAAAPKLNEESVNDRLGKALDMVMAASPALMSKEFEFYGKEVSGPKLGGE